ncbi:MAG: hypothetical protein QXK37_02215 [Candidatus Woesearchaeota archaeon]
MKLSERRGQIEIVGLLIIVVLLSLMLLFIIPALFKKLSSLQNEHTRRTLPGEFISAMLKTDSGCTKNTNIQDLIIDCARSPETGGTLELVCVDGNKSCAYMKNVLDQLLLNSFDAMKKNYEIVITSPDKRVIYSRNCSKSNGCTNFVTDEVQTETQPLPVWANYGNLEIMMCMGGCQR